MRGTWIRTLLRAALTTAIWVGTIAGLFVFVRARSRVPAATTSQRPRSRPSLIGMSAVTDAIALGVAAYAISQISSGARVAFALVFVAVAAASVVAGGRIWRRIRKLPGVDRITPWQGPPRRAPIPPSPAAASS